MFDAVKLSFCGFARVPVTGARVALPAVVRRSPVHSPCVHSVIHPRSPFNTPPFNAPPFAGIPIDGKTVFTSDHALKLDWLPSWVAIIGSGYIGLEFSDVYTALGSEVRRDEAFIPNSLNSKAL